MRLRSRLLQDGFAVRVALFYASLLVVTGIQVPFFPLWLSTRGLDPGEIGLILAAPMIARVFAAPLVTGTADRLGDLRATVIAASATALLGFMVIGFTTGFAAIFAVLTLASFAFTPIGSLMDAYALKGLAQRGMAYGPVRLWGSVAFVATNLGAGFALNVLGATNLIWLITGALGAMTCAALLLLPLKSQAVEVRDATPSHTSFWSSPVMLLTAIGASLIQASHAIYYSFSALDWTAKGFGGSAIGAYWGLGVVAEIIIFAFSGRGVRSMHPFAWLIAGALGGIVRWTAMAFDPAGWPLAALQCLHGLTFGAAHLGAVLFFAMAASQQRKASAQGYYATLQSIIAGLVTSISGPLYVNLGSRAYAVMAVAAALGGIFIYLAKRRNGSPWLANF